MSFIETTRKAYAYEIGPGGAVSSVIHLVQNYQACIFFFLQINAVEPHEDAVELLHVSTVDYITYLRNSSGYPAPRSDTVASCELLSLRR